MDNCPNNILKARQDASLSQKNIALTLGVSAPTVSDWERQKKYPTVENLKRLSDLLGVSVDFLLKRTNSPNFGRSASDRWDGLRLKEFRERFGESVEYAASAVGVSPSLYQAFEDSTLEPDISTLCKISEHFCLDADAILGLSWSIYVDDKIVTEDFRVSKKEQHLIELLRQLNDEGSEKISDYINDLIASGRYTKNGKYEMVHKQA